MARLCKNCSVTERRGVRRWSNLLCFDQSIFLTQINILDLRDTDQAGHQAPANYKTTECRVMERLLNEKAGSSSVLIRMRCRITSISM